MSLKVCLQFKPRFVRLVCLETSFVFCLDPREHESPPLWWCLVNLRIYIYHQKKNPTSVFAGIITPNSLNIWTKSKCLKSSYAYNKIDWQKKAEFAHFPISPSLHFQHLLSISTVRHAHLQWYQTGSSGVPKRGKNTAAVELRWNKLRHSSHPSVCASVGDFAMSKR